MQGGFAFLEAGAVRSKNVTNILMKNVLDLFICGVAYWLFGYAFAYGKGNTFIGYTHFASHNLPVTEYANLFYQFTFAATASTIISGAVAERCDFIAFLIYSFGITSFIYPVVTHWVWAGGFLSAGMDYGGSIGVVGFRDFAGSGVVHLLGGTAAFVGASIIGPRLGRFDKETKTVLTIRGHSVPIAALGGFILFFGFLAFNGGSQLSITKPGDGAAISIAVVNTVISGSFAACSSMFVNRLPKVGNKRWSLLIIINGALCGMVAVCSGCNLYYPWGAAAIGTIAGIVFHFYSWLVRWMLVDDPLDAVAVHFGGGSWGVMALAFFNNQDGILFNWDQKSGMVFCWQLAGLATICAWSAITMGIIFGTLRLLKILRVPRDVELRGLDIPKHAEPAYPVEAYGHGHVEKLMQILDTSGPFIVTQVYERQGKNGNVNYGFNHISDKGLYESPEVKRHVHQMKQPGGGSAERIQRSTSDSDTSDFSVDEVVKM
ncbi:putative ammonium transporter 1 [Dreissena polymorpha]|nr:putative ammonium transporter 1 [Dreissena polymorpha]